MRALREPRAHPAHVALRARPLRGESARRPGRSQLARRPRRERTEERGTLREGAARRHGEGILVSRSGEAPVSAACAPVFDGDGGLSGVVLVLHDLSLQRTLEATASRADRLAALGTVALGLAHEIKNPLGGIKGAAQLLRSAVTDPDLVRCTEIIVREVERLDGLVEQLRELSVPPQLQLEPVNIHRVLNTVLSLERQAPDWGAIALRTVFDPSLPPVR